MEGEKKRPEAGGRNGVKIMGSALDLGKAGVCFPVQREEGQRQMQSGHALLLGEETTWLSQY